jgi:hypothetical protein
MRTNIQFLKRAVHGYALMLTMFLIAVTLIVLGSVVSWTSTEAGLTSRNNLYNSTVAAAEAGTERVLAEIDRDFVYSSIKADSFYHSKVPDQTGWPVQFAYSDNAGTAGETGLQNLGPSVIANLNSEFTGLYGLVTPYRVTSQAAPIGQNFNVSAAVSQEFQMARIPIFQYAIFYSLDLEINPGPDMIVRGKVHSNGNIYAAPGSKLDFKDVVTAVGTIENNRHPMDPTTGGKTMPNYVKKTEKVSAMVLPIGTNNSPAAVQAILDPPLSGEDPDSSVGRQRIFNQADLIISNTPSGVTVSTGAWNGFKDVPPDNGTNYSFVSNASFYDYREGKTVNATQIDVAKFNTWLGNTGTNGGSVVNGKAQFKMSHGLNSVYALDTRPMNSASLSGVRVVNGEKLPADGLTVATAAPIYVKGNFNLNNGTDTSVGQTDTAKTQPAALIGDAVTMLSANWNDANTSTTGIGSRKPENTTVNAAILAGIVESQKDANGTKHYSGGVENFPRFLEDWSGAGKTLTYNGSMVVMFPSRYAKSFWSYGSAYTAPTRKWAFDMSFLNADRLPPLTPQVRKLVRGQWNVVASK